MSNLWFNIRIGKRHLMISPTELSFGRNTYWDRVPMGKYFEVYTWFGNSV